MTKWVALLRGVNVGGITVKSAELGALFRELGFEGVKTVLASGNVLFETDEGGTTAKDAALKKRIEKGLGERFGYDAWIVLLEHDRLAGIVEAYPFDETDGMQPYVVFASDEAVLREITKEAGSLDPEGSGAGTDGGERTAPGTGVLYWEVTKGSSTDTPFAKYLAKARFKSTTTTRNLRTLRKLL
ncbi:DUF1697 domain-containing protein [Herbiconiux sp. A18JL235]|uniref:DUF1697 domain-containing protein n=1 Tax=Herbiconiux sp. A18JL235 TaxID=3152363 RepID=A0AB39BFU3_9MICO